MRISESWLRELVSLESELDTLSEQLTMAGLEVDSVEPLAPEFNGVVVAEVIDVQPHPDADKLRVCTVNVGEEKPLQIVCGAPNVEPGMKAPAALIGAKLPGEFNIKKSKLRGVESFGMLCGASELGFEEGNEGLMVLPQEAPVGEDIRQYLDLDDQIIEIELTPNRGDCLSMIGIAREVAALNKTDLQLPKFDSVKAKSDQTREVLLDAPAGCPRYLGRIIEGLDKDAVTPEWMQRKLNKGGIRAISPLVDVTNFVLLETGHPMHAFDLDYLEGAIHVREATPDETLQLLDEKEVTFKGDELVIADDDRVLAMAGVMGGLRSAVTNETRHVFLECAYFSPTAIAGKAREFGMQTDSSYRFERGVNPAGLEQAMERATQLLIDICGGKAGPVTKAESPEHLVKRPTIVLRREQLNRILGVKVDNVRVVDILKRLEMQVKENDQGWHVEPPSFRFDIAIEADLIEEIGRIYGYNRLPTEPYAADMIMTPVPEDVIELQQVHERLFDRGYQEVITYSFVDPAIQQYLDPDIEAIALANPIASDMAVMRTTLWPGLVQVISHNLKRQQERARIFEYGLRFIKQDNDIKQENILAGAICGSRLPEQWGANIEPVDFYDIKGDLQALLSLGGAEERFSFTAEAHPALHPGQSACVRKDGQVIGWIGRLHPELLQKLGLKEDVFVFEVLWDAVAEAKLPAYTALSKYPSIRRDLAIVVDDDVSGRDILTTIKAVIPEIVKEIRIFDVYTGKGVDSGRKSVALGLILQESSRTLTDQDVESATARVVENLQKQLGATLRE